jgi:hypothetical protein
MKEFNNSKY